jgi:hypothetical protein
MSNPIRIVVCIDVEADTPAEAYATLHTMFAHVAADPVLGSMVDWESTDEWFDADGNPMTEAEQDAARKAFFQEVA